MFTEIKDFINSKQTVFLLLILLVLIALICYSSLFRRFDHDEFEAIHTTWKILNGQTIFTDFYQQKNPFFHYTLIPILQAFGESTKVLIAGRIYIFIIYLVSLFLTYLIAKNVFDKKVALVSAILLSTSTIFVFKSIEIRPDSLQIMFGLASILFLYTKFPNRPKLNLVLSSICLALSFVVLQKAIFFVFMTFILLLFRLKEKEIGFKDICMYFLVFLVTLVPFYIHIFSLVSFERYYELNWVINTKFLGGFSPVQNYQKFFTQDTFLWIFFILGLFELRHSKQKEIAFIAFYALIHVLFIQTPNKQYFMMAIPFMSMIGANFVCDISNKNFLILLLVITFPIVHSTQSIVGGTIRRNNHKQIQKINYVLANTKKDDYVYDGNIDFNLFRNDIDYFWFGVRKNGVMDTYKTFYDYDYDIYKSINKYKPKIISTFCVYDLNNPVIRDNYKQSPVYDNLYIMVK